ncbi:MAG: serine hydrolase domain-containing protein [Desulfococcaceae bacterium]
MERVTNLLEWAVREKVFPGAVLLVAVEGKIRLLHACGLANLFTDRKMATDTIFDLASLTKSLAAVPAVMKLSDAGLIDMKGSLETCLPELAGTDKACIQIIHLLVHSAGFPDHRPYYLRLDTVPAEMRKTALREMLVMEPLAYHPEEKTLYSDLGFMMLEWVIERIAGMPLDRFLQQSVYGPAGLKNLFFQNNLFPRTGSFAATEICHWRGRLLEGEVHDENAWAAGGVAAHAGLFGTAEEVFRLLHHLFECRAGIRRDGLFSKNTAGYFFSPFGNTGRCPGFDRPSGTEPSCGRFFSANTAGHLGFTGTSFWMDLDRAVTVILLSNRVHPSRKNIRIRAFRPLIHNAVMEALKMDTFLKRESQEILYL